MTPVPLVPAVFNLEPEVAGSAVLVAGVVASLAGDGEHGVVVAFEGIAFVPFDKSLKFSEPGSKMAPQKKSIFCL